MILNKMPTETNIKYRVWSRTLGKFLQNHLPFISPDGRLYLYYAGELLEEKDGHSDFVVESCTRLIDHNGKDIYEGDLIKVDNDDSKYLVYFNGVNYSICVPGTRIYQLDEFLNEASYAVVVGHNFDKN